MRVIDRNSRVYLFIPYIVLMLLYLKISVFRYVVIAFLMFAVLTGIVINKLIPKRYLLIVMFFMLHFYAALGIASLSGSIKIVLQDLIWIAPILIFDTIEAVDKNRRRTACKVIFIIMSVTLIYCMIRSFIYALNNPYAIRSMANFDVTETPAGMPLAIGGGYPLIFAVIILIPYLVYLCKNYWKNNKIVAFISIIILVFSAELLVVSNVTTAVLLAALGSAWMLVVNKKSNNAVILAITIITVAFVITNPVILEWIIKTISELFDESSVIYIRLQEIIPALSGNNSSSAFGDRFLLAERSWSTIWKFPFWGAGFYEGYNYYSLVKLVGHHCEWIDFLATYGILMGGLFFAFLYASVRKLLNVAWLREKKSIYTVLIILYIVIGFMDPVLSTNALLILFVYIPCAECTIGGRNNEKNSVCNL